MTMSDFIIWLLGVFFGIGVGWVLVNEYHIEKCKLCKRKGNDKCRLCRCLRELRLDGVRK